MDATVLIGFSLVALGMVLTPGPNMMYLVSRSVCQGRRAGLVSLGGVGTAFLFYVLASASGITALLMAVPLAYNLLRFAGAAYLLYLAWLALRPGSKTSFTVRELKPDSDRKLFMMGFMTNLLNPKAAVLYLSLLPQFIDVGKGHVFAQAVLLGFTQIVISMSVNGSIILMASSAAKLLGRHPAWERAQRWLMGTVLSGLALKMALDVRK